MRKQFGLNQVPHKTYEILLLEAENRALKKQVEVKSRLIEEGWKAIDLLKVENQNIRKYLEQNEELLGIESINRVVGEPVEVFPSDLGRESRSSRQRANRRRRKENASELKTLIETEADLQALNTSSSGEQDGEGKGGNVESSGGSRRVESHENAESESREQSGLRRKSSESKKPEIHTKHVHLSREADRHTFKCEKIDTEKILNPNEFEGKMAHLYEIEVADLALDIEIADLKLHREVAREFFPGVDPYLPVNIQKLTPVAAAQSLLFIAIYFLVGAIYFLVGVAVIKVILFFIKKIVDFLWKNK